MPILSLKLVSLSTLYINISFSHSSVNMLTVLLQLSLIVLPALTHPVHVVKGEWEYTRLIEPRQCRDKGQSGAIVGDKGPQRWEYTDESAIHNATLDRIMKGNVIANTNGEKTTRTSTLIRTVTQVQTQQPQPTSLQPPPSPTRGDTGPQVDDSNTKGKISSTDPKELLTLHNGYRASHEAGPLTWNNEMQDYATKYALNCEFKHSCVIPCPRLTVATLPMAKTCKRANTRV